LFLIKYDNNEFNKFEAAQKYFLEIILKNIYNHDIKNDSIKESKIDIDKNFVNIIKIILKDKKLENSLKAEIIILPSENFIADKI
jgi:hypothetical protein